MVLLSVDEISKHNREKDCWIIVRGKVYNVTSYLDDHPGGVEIVLDLAGKDATEDYDDVGHSDEAHGILAGYYIGDVEGDKQDSGKAVANAAASTQGKYAESSVKKQEEPNYLLLGAGVASIAAAAGYFLLKRKK